ncbi:hypothetical protein A4H97_04390 [Niastella yeongjuensis]|uniref:Uncharacterized protein n=1 Tax=Niastella yeongjuensis TaxID=354355 RepID=A0A1V9EY77_9BACT|nr:hypothetical protein [Niastella yeongjuensis]OQP51058.1 hypothetical protein A4H97_04390 [Niastella yeongjuensis]SEN04633.1 hypothetical protein SAMN05660816_00056 [Niastella yeongjuensis]
MFGLFSKKQPECPIDNNTRLWMEQAFVWLVQEFGQNNLLTKPMLFPTTEHFPILYNGTKESFIQTAHIIARQMEIDLQKINLDIFNESVQELKSDYGFSMFTQPDESSEVPLTAGLYFGKNESGKFDVFIEKNNLSDPEKLVATIAHEFAHIKLLDEKQVPFNDESLTDLTTVLFGIGIFNANCAFREIKNFSVRGHSTLGYLKQREWGYALALYAYFRQENNPGWINHLTPNIRSDFKKSTAFIYANPDKIFREQYNPGKQP